MIQKMIEQLNKLYEKEAEDNKVLKSWIDKLADFILINYYQMTYVDTDQWNTRKEEVVRKICLGE